MRLITTLLCVLMMSACSATLGAVYDEDAPNITLSEAGSKTGSAKCTRLFGYNMGDCSIGGAMADGRIAKLHTVSYKSLNLLIYKSNTTIVTGE